MKVKLPRRPLTGRFLSQFSDIQGYQESVRQKTFLLQKRYSGPFFRAFLLRSLTMRRKRTKKWSRNGYFYRTDPWTK